MATFTSPESMWIKFFSEAGLPPGIGATYALTFTDNRIQMNMLLDLNKEYLRDMGITCLGDVIAILKHAKKFHDDTARDRVLSISGPKVPVATVTGRPGMAKPTTPTTRMLEHYTRNPPISPAPANSMANVKERLGAIHITGAKRKVVTRGNHSSSPDSTDGRVEAIIPAKHKRENLKQQNVFEEYVTKSASDSKLPSVKKLSTSPSSVFNRLGLNEESRTSLSANKSPPNVTITGLKKTITKSSNSSSNTVFSRLGGKGDETRRSSSDSNEPLKYEGILKGSSPIKKTIINRTTSAETFKPVKKVGTMRADEEPINVREKLPLSHQRKSVKFSSHIDYKEIENRASTNVPPHTPTIPAIRTVALSKVSTVVPVTKKVVKRTLTLSKKSSVKTRLGKTSLISKRSKSNVFGRLGITSKM